MTRCLVAYDGTHAAREAVARVVALYGEGDAVGVISVGHGPVGGTQLNRPSRSGTRRFTERSSWRQLLCLPNMASSHSDRCLWQSCERDLRRRHRGVYRLGSRNCTARGDSYSARSPQVSSITQTAT